MRACNVWEYINLIFPGYLFNYVSRGEDFRPEYKEVSLIRSIVDAPALALNKSSKIFVKRYLCLMTN